MTTGSFCVGHANHGQFARNAGSSMYKKKNKQITRMHKYFHFNFHIMSNPIVVQPLSVVNLLLVYTAFSYNFRHTM